MELLYSSGKSTLDTAKDAKKKIFDYKFNINKNIDDALILIDKQISKEMKKVR